MKSLPPLTNPVEVTKHAMRRARKRVGWPRRAITRMASRAYEHGTRFENARDQHLRLFLNTKLLFGGSTEISVYGEFVYIFGLDQDIEPRQRVVLLTVYHLPSDFRCELRKDQSRKPLFRLPLAC